MVGPKKECVYQVSPEWAGFLTKVQPIMLTELERIFYSQYLSDTISSVIFQ